MMIFDDFDDINSFLKSTKIFDIDYRYKVHLLGYRYLKTKQGELKDIFLKSHDLYYEIRTTASNNTSGYFDCKIKVINDVVFLPIYGYITVVEEDAMPELGEFQYIVPKTKQIVKPLNILEIPSTHKACEAKIGMRDVENAIITNLFSIFPNAIEAEKRKTFIEDIPNKVMNNKEFIKEYFSTNDALMERVADTDAFQIKSYQNFLKRYKEQNSL